LLFLVWNFCWWSEKKKPYSVGISNHSLDRGFQAKREQVFVGCRVGGIFNRGCLIV
jgi:hypothetical protein